MSNRNCILLPNEIGEGVIKISLQKDSSETARVILFVTANGCVYEHSHDIENNSDSEIYIDLLDLTRKGINNLSVLPEVAGSNSPTGRIKHSIQKSNYPQVILAIKKGQEEDAWNEFSRNFETYFQSLGVTCCQDRNRIIITSDSTGERQESIIIDTERNSVIYSGNNQEFVTLDELQNAKDVIENEISVDK